MTDAPLLEVRDLRKEFAIERGLFRRSAGTLRAVDGVSFRIARGESLGVVGESGCGKRTLARCVMRLLEPTSGSVRLTTRGETVDLATLDASALRRLRPRMQMVFQDPQSFLDPRMTAGEAIAEPLLLNGARRGAALDARVAALLEEVGLHGAEAARWPQSLSGGQKQRVGIARALALEPDLLIADEPVSALDVSVRSQVLELLARLRATRGLTLLFISHDLRTVAALCDRVAVLYLGRIVEIAPAKDLFLRPRHPYTEALLSAIPLPAAAGKRRTRIRLGGEPPSPADPPPGCRFHPRCAYVQDVCRREDPPLVQVGAHRAACHFAETLPLEGLPT